ncbi:MAG: tetratricopeptide repeat protein [Bacteroidales bacterium]|nr:tetratricopeptide repeat protein [Bacteroidales bacterium]
MIKTKHIGLLLLLLLSFTIKAQDFSSNLYQAEQLYAQSKYDSAALYYHSIIDSGYQSPELYYNLANTYFKLQEIPTAILYYEKALKLDPNDENIIYNLNLCNTLIPDRIEEVPRLFFIRWYQGLYNYFPIDTWSYIGLVLFSIFTLLLLIYFLSPAVFWKKIGFWSGIFVLFTSLFVFYLTSQKYSSFKQHNEAIIFMPSITVKSSPAKNSVDLFVIHEGTKVTILDQVGNWRKVKIQNGSIGWIEAENLQII